MKLPESDSKGGNDDSTRKQEVVKVPKVASRALWIMGLSIILVLYVHTSLSPALTQMVTYFDSDYGTVSWVLTAYLVSGAAVTIVIGRLADIYGAKKMMLLVFLCYIVGTVLGGFAQNIYTLLIFRVIQGVAVALVPIAIRIARDLYPKEKFPFAQGVILAMYQGGSAIGLGTWCCSGLFRRMAMGVLLSNTICFDILLLIMEVYSQRLSCSSC